MRSLEEFLLQCPSTPQTGTHQRQKVEREHEVLEAFAAAVHFRSVAHDGIVFLSVSLQPNKRMLKTPSRSLKFKKSPVENTRVCERNSGRNQQTKQSSTWKR